MKIVFLSFIVAFIFGSCKPSTDQHITGLLEEVEILRDSSGVNHIYAKNEHDLFFTQGYAAAKDRLFQFEMWRRQATGTTAEILGSREIKRDIGARLFKFRGDIKKELNHYHPRGEQIINAFTDGINAYITETQKNPKLLPFEFRLLGITPGKWSPEIVISRHQGLLGNIGKEVNLGRAVGIMGPEKIKQLDVFEPGEPVLALDPKIKKELLMDSVIELYDAYRKTLKFQPGDLLASSNKNMNEYASLNQKDESDSRAVQVAERQNIGSNNWIVSGALTQSGFPLLANDPHRAVTAPSLRYMVHLSAPGWNVVGGGEPTIPGVSIGHNDDAAWGLTVFSIDGEDLYVYELNPENQNQYKFKDGWEEMQQVQDSISVKGGERVAVTHLFTKHGPVTYVDRKNNVAYAIRCAWLEPGGAPYLASLRIDQAKTWEEFRQGCSFSHIPGENMIWADKNGNIGWQAVGIAPRRENWSGLVPVPGDGSYEWSGYLSITALPNEFNPPKGFLVTANENLIPVNYEHREAVGWNWADPYRAQRLREALSEHKKFSSEDMMKMQFDYVSLPARSLIPLLKNLHSANPVVEEIRLKLLSWNYTLDKNSPEAAAYVAWEKKLTTALKNKMIPEEAKKFVTSIPTSKIIHWIKTADPLFGKNASKGRDIFLISQLEEAVKEVEIKLGPDWKTWRYGQPSYHHVLIKHPLANAVDSTLRSTLTFGPIARGGYSSTPGSTSNTDNQTHGASFRIVADVSNWDNCMFTNAPGQSGDPASPYFGNLFEGWANDRHFPVYFTRALVEKSATEKSKLIP